MFDINAFNELKRLLEGQTVLQICKTNSPEGICEFHLSNGTAFKLFATELGYWTRITTVNDEYHNLNDLILDYAEYCDDVGVSDLLQDISIDKKAKTLSIKTCHKSFTIKLSYLNNVEKNIINNKFALETLKQSIECGDMWKCFFSKTHKFTHSKMPKNCRF